MKTQKEELKLRKAELKRLLKEAGKLSKKDRERVEEGEVANLQQQLIHEKRQRKLLQRQVSLSVLFCSDKIAILQKFPANWVIC